MTCEAQYSKDLYANILPDETGMSTGYAPVGFVELACDADRWHYYRRVAAFNRHCGVDVREISAADVEVLFPACLDSSSSSSSNDVLAGFYVATDGRVNPHEATMALARAARMRGVVIREGVTVERVTTARDPVVSLVPRVTGVEISQSASSAVSLGGSTNTNDSTGVERIRANVVVNCAGMWARQLGEANGVAIPNQAAEHYYLLTDAMPEIDPLSPVIEDSSKGVYVRPEGGGLMLGLFEGKGAAWNAKRIPNDFSFGQIDPDWNRMVR